MTKKSNIHVSHGLVSNGIDVSRESSVADSQFISLADMPWVLIPVF